MVYPAAYCVYEVYSWDVMEPASYFLMVRYIRLDGFLARPTAPHLGLGFTRVGKQQQQQQQQLMPESYSVKNCSLLQCLTYIRTAVVPASHSMDSPPPALRLS